MPLTRHDRPVARLNLVPHLTRLPVPEAHIATGVATHDDLAIRADVDVDRIPGVVVAAEALLAILAEALGAGIDDDLVISGLEGDELAGRVGRGADHAEHVRLGDELDGHGDPVLPRAQGLVVGGRDEAAGGVAEGEGVDGAEVMVVLLHEGAGGGGGGVLFGGGAAEGSAGAGVELDDLLVGHAGEELVAERVVGRVEADDVRRLAGRVPAQTGACLGVPQLHLPVVRGGEEAGAVAVERDVVDGLGVARVRAQEFALVVHVEQEDFGVRRGRQQQVARVRHEAHLRHRLRVRFPRVDQLLGRVVLQPGRVSAQIDVEVQRDVHVRSALVVALLCPVERARLPSGTCFLVVRSCFCLGCRWLWSNLVFFVDDLDVFAVLVRSSSVRPFFLESCPWSFVGVGAVDDGGVATLFAFVLFGGGLESGLIGAVAGAERGFTQDNLARKPGRYASAEGKRHCRRLCTLCTKRISS